MLGQLRALRWARGASEVVHGPENFRGSWSYPLLEGAVAESVLFCFLITKLYFLQMKALWQFKPQVYTERSENLQGAF